MTLEGLAWLGWVRLDEDGAHFPCGCRLERAREGHDTLVRIRYCPSHTATTDAVSRQTLSRGT
jgi:hypothetical protein